MNVVVGDGYMTVDYTTLLLHVFESFYNKK